MQPVYIPQKNNIFKEILFPEITNCIPKINSLFLFKRSLKDKIPQRL